MVRSMESLSGTTWINTQKQKISHSLVGTCQQVPLWQQVKTIQAPILVEVMDVILQNCLLIITTASSKMVPKRRVIRDRPNRKQEADCGFLKHHPKPRVQLLLHFLLMFPRPLPLQGHHRARHNITAEEMAVMMTISLLLLYEQDRILQRAVINSETPDKTSGCTKSSRGTIRHTIHGSFVFLSCFFVG